MWLSDRKGGLVAALYGPSVIHAKVGLEQLPVTVTQETEFPFSDKIQFHFKTNNADEFSFSMRIPYWTKNAQIYLNDTQIKKDPKPGTFYKLTSKFNNGDIITLLLPSELRMVPVENGYAIEKGPLVYTLDINEIRTPLCFMPWGKPNKKRKPDTKFPKWNIEPASEWRYGFAFEPEKLSEIAKIETKPVGSHPWESCNAPITIKLPVKLIKDWDYEYKPAEQVRIWLGMKDSEERPEIFKFTPSLPENSLCEKHIQKVDFVPYGSTCLRMTVLPFCK
jgi:hypothetical protein